MGKRRSKNDEDGLVFPDLPSSELSAEDMIDQAAARFEQHRVARDARRWMEIKVKQNKPIAICFMGDPHIDSGGCNWSLLKRDIGYMEDTEGLYVVNIGDTTDNWVGRLQRLYADAEMTKKAAWKLAAYLLKQAKIKWMCILLGNHDLWGDGPYLLKANAPPLVPVEEWQSRFVVVFPNGSRVKIHASHDFPGSSIWNPAHGMQKASMLMEDADIYVCGHKHNWSITQSENSQRGFMYFLLRAKGYKFIDSYANNHNFGEQKHGASITVVIDPMAEEGHPQKMHAFPDLREAVEFLKWKRAQPVRKK